MVDTCGSHDRHDNVAMLTLVSHPSTAHLLCTYARVISKHLDVCHTERWGMLDCRLNTQIPRPVASSEVLIHSIRICGGASVFSEWTNLCMLVTPCRYQLHDRGEVGMKLRLGYGLEGSHGVIISLWGRGIW